MPRTVSIFRNNRNQAIRLPRDMEFQGVTELTIERHGDTIVLRPVRPDGFPLRASRAPTRTSCATVRT